MDAILTVVFQNYEWVFSGLGVALIVYFIPKKEKKQDITINVGSAKMEENASATADIIAFRQNQSTSIVNRKDLLIVVDIQRDFFEGGTLAVPEAESLIKPLNELIRFAQNRDCDIVLARDWHPPDHKSFMGAGGHSADWPAHCVRDTDGAKFHDGLNITEDMTVVNIGAENDDPDYSAFDDHTMREKIKSDNIGIVYVVGIALEFCVLATCLDALKFGKGIPVVALEPFIRSASIDEEKLEEVWSNFMSQGIIRAHNMAGFDITVKKPHLRNIA